jgi:hypothetical protein
VRFREVRVQLERPLGMRAPPLNGLRFRQVAGTPEQTEGNGQRSVAEGIVGVQRHGVRELLNGGGLALGHQVSAAQERFIGFGIGGRVQLG